jgi:hypothetical protein
MKLHAQHDFTQNNIIQSAIKRFSTNLQQLYTANAIRKGLRVITVILLRLKLAPQRFLKPRIFRKKTINEKAVKKQNKGVNMSYKIAWLTC